MHKARNINVIKLIIEMNYAKINIQNYDNLLLHRYS